MSDLVTALVREFAVAMSGLVVGAALLAMYRYRIFAKDSAATPNEVTRLKLAAWAAATIAAFAAFQGFTRALLILSDAPLDYRDWATILLQLNSFVLLVATTRSENKWRTK